MTHWSDQKTYEYRGFKFIEHAMSVNQRTHRTAKKPVIRYAFFGGKIFTEAQIRHNLDIAIKRGEVKPAA